MSSEIEAKRNFKIRINEKILSYNSINNVFKNTFQCNMFDSIVKVSCGYGIPEFSLKIKCSINKYKSADFLMDELGKLFTTYNISKDKEKNVIYLNAMLFYNFINNYETINKFCEYEVIKEYKKENWFSLFINDVEFDLYKIKLIVENKNQKKVDEISYVEIDNGKTFIFRCDKETCSIDYEELFPNG
jgi:hypothetical protein